ncbi:MAG TPA: energy transducer TonB [Terriglobales bacterium]|nr:energy transducer TonB [Terriglobales bacterium]
MFDSAARRFRRSAAPSKEQEYRPLGIEKRVSRQLWEQAQKMAIGPDGQIDVCRAMTLFDELVLREHDRLQAESGHKVVSILDPNATSQPYNASPDLDPASSSQQLNGTSGIGPTRPAGTGQVLQFAALCSICGMPAGEARKICAQCALTSPNQAAEMPSAEATGAPTVPPREASSAPQPPQVEPPSRAAEFQLFDFDPEHQATQAPSVSTSDNERDYPFRTLRPTYPEAKERSPRRLKLAIVVAALVVVALLSWKYIAAGAGSIWRELQQSPSESDGTTSQPLGEARRAPSANRTSGAAKPPRGRPESDLPDLRPVPKGSESSAIRTGRNLSGILAESAGASSVSLSPGQRVSSTPPVQIAPKEAAALLVREVAPQYPPEAQAAGVLGGHVTLGVTVDDAGRVIRADPISGDVKLVDSAMAAVKLWRYRPLVKNGKAASFETTVIVDFSLASPRPLRTVQ